MASDHYYSWWRWQSETLWVTFIRLYACMHLSCHLPSVVVEICLQFHSLMCLIVALLEIPLVMPKILCWCYALKLCKDLARFFKLKIGRFCYSQFPSQWEGDYLSDWDIAPLAGRFHFFGGICRNINLPAPFLLRSPPLSLPA